MFDIIIRTFLNPFLKTRDRLQKLFKNTMLSAFPTNRLRKVLDQGKDGSLMCKCFFWLLSQLDHAQYTVLEQSLNRAQSVDCSPKMPSVVH
jgi:hypothetical protein